MSEKLASLLEYAKGEGRVCPLPKYWDLFFQTLPERRTGTGSGEPHFPLILGGWYSSAQAKAERLAEHINWAAAHGTLEAADKFLRSLKPDQWVYGEKHLLWEEWQKGK